MSVRNRNTLHRVIAAAVIAVIGSGTWLTIGVASREAGSPAQCTSAPCVAEAGERLEAPKPAERTRRPAAPALDWRNLLPARILRPR